MICSARRRTKRATTGLAGISSRGSRAGMQARAAVFVLSGLLLSGCALASPSAQAPSSAPAPAPTPAGTTSTTEAPTQAPTLEPTVSTIQLSGSALTSETETGEPISSVAFADGTEASVAFLTSALGAEPEQSVPGEMEACNNVTARYSWGDTALVLDVWEPAGFVINMGESSVNGIRLQSSGGFAAGEDAQAFFDALPAELALDEYGDGTGPFVYDKIADSAPWGDDNAYGGVALLQQGGIVNRIVSPDTTHAFYC